VGGLLLVSVLSVAVGGPRWHGSAQHSAAITAGLTPQARTGLSSLLLTAWAGPGLLIGLAASALVLGGLLLCRCDA